MSILTGGVIQDLKGVINLTSATKNKKFGRKSVSTKFSSTGLEVIGVDKPSRVIHHKPLEIAVNFDTISGGVNFKDTYLKAENINILFDGKIASSGKKIPVMDFNLEIKPSSMESVCAILPWFRDIPHEMDFYKFKEYGVWGNGEGKLHFVGKGERPKVYGDVKLSNVDGVQRGIIAKEGGTVTMHFGGYDMNIDVYVPVLNKQFVEVKGFVKIDGTKYSELDIRTSDAIPMEPAQVILNPLHDMLKFKIGPVPIMKIKGFGKLHVVSKGKKIDPHLWGEMNFWNATAEFTQIHNLILHNGSGEIIFDNRDITFKTSSANALDLLIKGLSFIRLPPFTNIL